MSFISDNAMYVQARTVQFVDEDYNESKLRVKAAQENSNLESPYRYLLLSNLGEGNLACATLVTKEGYDNIRSVLNDHEDLEWVIYEWSPKVEPDEIIEEFGILGYWSLYAYSPNSISAS